ncbi:MAG: methyltransferase domain-containing protein [bacterium]|nr:methyltransferase domain-containing protein [bacterium]
MDESTFLNPTKVLEAAHLHEGMHIADFGCGSGFFTRAAARLVGEQGQVWAVDAHRDMLPRVKNLALAEGLRNVEVIYGDLESRSSPDASVGGSNLPAAQFDFCIVANLLFAVEDKKALVQEVFRILKNGGRALVVDWSASFGGLGPHPSQVVGMQAAKALFAEGGFAFVEQAPAGEYHWGFVVRKKTN